MSENLTTLQARAVRDYGVPWEAFDSLTPRELTEIANDFKSSWIADQKIRDMRAARVAAAVYRLGGCKNIKEEDLMTPYDDQKTEAQKQEVESCESMMAKLSMWAAMAGS